MKIYYGRPYSWGRIELREQQGLKADRVCG